MDVLNECLDYLWALYDSLSAKCLVIIMGDLNGDLGNSLGGRGKYEANDRGLKILDFINFFNLCPVNLLPTSCGPLETFVVHSGRYKSTLDYILLPNCLFDSIIFCKTFDKSIDNTSDHLPATLKIKYHFNSRTLNHNDAIQNHTIKSKITWSSFSKEEIDNNYSVPLMNELNTLALDEYNSLACSSDAIIALLTKHASSLARPICRNKTKAKVYFKLPPDVKDARLQGKIAFNAWKASDFPSEGNVYLVYRSKRNEYRLKLREFLNQLEADKIIKLSHAAESDEKLFWKLIKGQRSSSQMTAFLVNDTLLTDRSKIRQMWADHFETLGTPSVNDNFDNNFCADIANRVREVFDSCMNDPSGELCEPLRYEEVESVCASLKAGISGVEIDYEQIRFPGPPLRKLLSQLCQDFFMNHSFCESLLTGIILPLLKGKGAKANNNDNYRGITLFPTLCKIYEMVLLNRLEKHAVDEGLFSDMQFGFKEGVGCPEASFTILETINHMLERGSKVFGRFLDVRKAFDTVWIDGLLYKLFSEFGVKGRMWLAIKTLYTGVKAPVLYSGSLSRKFVVSQGTGQGRILAPFM